MSLVTGLPLLDVLDTLYGEIYDWPDLRDWPNWWGRTSLKLSEVEFWEPTQELREEPTGVVAVNTLGHLFDSERAGRLPALAPRGLDGRIGCTGSLFLGDGKTRVCRK